MAESGKEFERLLDLIAQLRAEDGCPWDREQTPATIKRYLLEEVYELVDAVVNLLRHYSKRSRLVERVDWQRHRPLVEGCLLLILANQRPMHKLFLDYFSSVSS